MKTTQYKNFAVVYSKKRKRKKRNKKVKLSKNLKLYKTYETVELATNAIISDPILKKIGEVYNIYIIEIVEDKE